MLAAAVLPAGLAGAVIAALPFLLSGFMHLDGFMDTSDAILSWRPLEERLRILKDSHTGSFAVVNLAMLMLFTYGAALSALTADLRVLVLIPVVSRCGSAFCVTTLKPLGHSEYKDAHGSVAQRLAIVVVYILSMLAGVLWLGRGVIALAATTLGYALAMLWAARTLKGVSGDLAGFALSIAETCGLAVLACL